MQLGLVPIVHVFGKFLDHIVQLFTSLNDSISVVIIGSKNAVCNSVVAIMVFDMQCAFGLNNVEFFIDWIQDFTLHYI